MIRLKGDDQDYILMPQHEFDECRAVLHKLWSNMGSAPAMLRYDGNIPQRLEALMCGEFRPTLPPLTEPKGSHDRGYNAGWLQGSIEGESRGRREGDEAGYKRGMLWGFVYGVAVTVVAIVAWNVTPAHAEELTLKRGDEVVRCTEGYGTTECTVRQLPPDPSACTDGLTLISMRKFGVLTHVCAPKE